MPFCDRIEGYTRALAVDHTHLEQRVETGFIDLQTQLEGKITREEAEQLVRDAEEKAEQRLREAVDEALKRSQQHHITPGKLTVYDYLKDLKLLEWLPKTVADWMLFYDIASMIESPELLLLPGKDFPYRYYSRLTLWKACQRYWRDTGGTPPLGASPQEPPA